MPLQAVTCCRHFTLGNVFELVGGVRKKRRERESEEIREGESIKNAEKWIGERERRRSGIVA